MEGANGGGRGEPLAARMASSRSGRGARAPGARPRDARSGGERQRLALGRCSPARRGSSSSRPERGLSAADLPLLTGAMSRLAVRRARALSDGARAHRVIARDHDVASSGGIGVVDPPLRGPAIGAGRRRRARPRPGRRRSAVRPLDVERAGAGRLLVLAVAPRREASGPPDGRWRASGRSTTPSSNARGPPRCGSRSGPARRRRSLGALDELGSTAWAISRLQSPAMARSEIASSARNRRAETNSRRGGRAPAR